MPNRPAYQREIENQALVFIRDYALVAYASLVFSLSLVALAIYQSYPSDWVLIWLCAICVIETATFIYRQQFPVTNMAHQKKLRCGVSINIFEGLVVASCLLFFPYVDDITRMLIVTMLLIACTGAIATTVGYFPFYLAFTAPVITSTIGFSIAAPIFFGGSNTLFVVSILSLMSVYPLVKMSRAILQHFREAFEANLRYLQANEQLQKAVKDARLANSSKTRFLAAASHDLRQPINTLSLFVANLSLKKVDDDQAEIIAHMNTAIKSVDAQLESLLDMSKLDSGAVNVNMTEIDLVPLVQDIVTTFESQGNKGLTISFHSSFESITANTDTVLFERVLNNLISNSIKYTHLGRINVTLYAENGRARLTVEDTGIGIDRDELAKVFEEFYQVGNPERSESNGLGLGLSIVARLADLLNLKVDLSSEAGVGTEVVVSLDAINATQTIATEQVVSNEDVKINETQRVIALDNESSILVALRGVVETLGHSIETYTDAKEAVNAAALNHYDIALIDYRLPGSLNGQQVIDQMKKNNKQAQFFLITGDSSLPALSSDYEIIYKPLTGKKLNLIFN